MTILFSKKFSTMLQFRAIFLTVIFWTLLFATPIKNGENVGELQKIDGKLQLTNKNLYPYMVRIKISVPQGNGKQRYSYCGGVIIGKWTVLTAGHCLYRKVNPTVTVRAGVIDLNLEKKKGQKIKMKEYLLHPEYRDECKINEKSCCYEENDIAILWLKEQFEFGSYIQRAKLNGNLVKPIKQNGWILGWGLDNTNNLSTMLQRGEVQVISRAECIRYNPTVYVNEKVLCLKSGSKGAQAAQGDSGGPFEINGVVHGISSHSIYKEYCRNEEVEVYTDVAQYWSWIDKNVRLGLPSKRPSSPHGQRKIPNQRPPSS